MSHSFWIGDEHGVPSLNTRRTGLALDTTNLSGDEIILALGKNPDKGAGSLRAHVAAERLLKFDFSNETLPYAADVLRIAKIAGRGTGAMLRWL